MKGLPCISTCEPRSKGNVESTGWRASFFYPGGGVYKGGWLRSQTQRFGRKVDNGILTYTGHWQKGARHGCGSMDRRLPDGTETRAYFGEWRNDMKHGRGRQYYADGMYEGDWRYNRRCGMGMRWYNDGSFYIGQWQADVRHGIGVQKYANGNRYEGHFARGYKNGEGTFYHMLTGQVQKGMWDNDTCKASMVMDKHRNHVPYPTEYPIPKIGIAHPDAYIRELFCEYKANANKPPRSYHELICRRFAEKRKKFIRLDCKATTDSKIIPFEVKFPCVCSKIEKKVVLRERDIN